jgi:hypothetical protein
MLISVLKMKHRTEWIWAICGKRFDPYNIDFSMGRPMLNFSEYRLILEVSTEYLPMYISFLP